MSDLLVLGGGIRLDSAKPNYNTTYKKVALKIIYDTFSNVSGIRTVPYIRVCMKMFRFQVTLPKKNTLYHLLQRPKLVMTFLKKPEAYLPKNSTQPPEGGQRNQRDLHRCLHVPESVVKVLTQKRKSCSTNQPI